MSDKEKIIELLDTVSDEKLKDALIYLQTLVGTESDDEKIDRSARRILEKYRPAFEELAK